MKSLSRGLTKKVEKVENNFHIRIEIKGIFALRAMYVKPFALTLFLSLMQFA
jgi:hypothetical protein